MNTEELNFRSTALNKDLLETYLPLKFAPVCVASHLLTSVFRTQIGGASFISEKNVRSKCLTNLCQS